MDALTLDDLRTLVDQHTGRCVSLFMPTHRTGAETRQDPIRLKNLLREAQDGLNALGLRSPHVRELLAPAQARLTDSAFWRHQSDGLALFLAPNLCRSYRLPLGLAAQVVVADRFHVKPLLPLFTGDGHFFVLALSQNQVRLLEAARHSVDEIELDIPGMAEAVRSDVERQIQFHTRTAGGMGQRAAVFHGHDDADLSKERILQYFREVDGRLGDVLREENAPLVLVGVEFLFAIYREANTYPYLLERGVAGNPEALPLADLHAQAWAVVQPHFLEARREAEALYQQLVATDRTSTDLREVILAAHGGQVEVLFVALDIQEWGRFDLESGTVRLDQAAAPGNEDLLDLAAIQTIMNRGTVYAVESGSVPGRASLAAVMRY